MRTWARAGLIAALLVAGCAHEKAAGRLWVHSVRFNGNAHIPSRQILDHIQLEASSRLPLAPKRYLDPLTLDVDRRRIVAYYRAQGFFSARVTAMRVKKRDGFADVEIDIDEGPRTFVRTLDVAGLETVPEEARRRVLKGLPLRVGQPFVHERYVDTRDLVQARIRDEGYPWAVVTGEARVNRDTQSAAVLLSVVPGAQARFGRVIVRGSPDADDVARRSGIVSGQRYRLARMDAARARLLATGRFVQVTVRAVPREGDPSIADVLVEVVPSARNEIKVGIGLGLDQDRQELHLPVRYTRYGFFGGLRTLSLRARPAYVALPSLINRERSGPALLFDAAFMQPDFLTRDLTLRLAVGYDLGVDYAFKYHGPRAQVGVDYAMLRGRLVASASYNFQYTFFWDLAAPDVFNNPNLARQFIGYTSPYRLAYVVESITYDVRDSAIEPRRGYYVRLGFEEGAAALGGAFNYEKIVPDVRGYVPLGRRVVASARVVYGRLFSQNGASPITQRFYAGGAESHRGFGYNRLSPQVPSTTGTLAVPVGGTTLLLAQLELRVNVLRLYGSWVGLAGFFDAGDVPDRSLDLTQLHLAVGPGLRYLTPIGVIRADLGIRLNRLSPFQPDGRQNPDPGQRYSFHLSIGEAF